MIRTSMLGLAAMAALAGLLAGCQGVELPYDQRVVAVLRETTNENPVQATLKVDGKEVFGPGDLTPGATREIVLHDPAADSARKLTPGTGHRISWQLRRSGRMNKVGSADLMIYSGTKMIKSDSTKYIMPGFWVDGWLEVKLVAAGAPAKAGPPKP